MKKTWHDFKRSLQESQYHNKRCLQRPARQPEDPAGLQPAARAGHQTTSRACGAFSLVQDREGQALVFASEIKQFDEHKGEDCELKLV